MIHSCRCRSPHPNLDSIGTASMEPHQNPMDRLQSRSRSCWNRIQLGIRLLLTVNRFKFQPCGFPALVCNFVWSIFSHGLARPRQRAQAGAKEKEGSGSCGSGGGGGGGGSGGSGTCGTGGGVDKSADSAAAEKPKEDLLTFILLAILPSC